MKKKQRFFLVPERLNACLFFRLQHKVPLGTKTGLYKILNVFMIKESQNVKLSLKTVFQIHISFTFLLVLQTKI